MKHSISIKIKAKKTKDGMTFDGDFTDVAKELKKGNHITGFTFDVGTITYFLSNKPIPKSDILDAIAKEPEPPAKVNDPKYGLGELYPIYIPDMAMDFIKNTFLEDPKVKANTNLKETLEMAVAMGLKKIGLDFMENRSGKTSDELLNEAQTVGEQLIGTGELPPHIEKMILENKKNGKKPNIKKIIIDGEDPDALDKLKKLLGL